MTSSAGWNLQAGRKQNSEHAQFDRKRANLEVEAPHFTSDTKNELFGVDTKNGAVTLLVTSFWHFFCQKTPRIRPLEAAFPCHSC